MSILAIIFLTVNTAISAIRSLDDPWTFAFVVSVYVLLMLLFLFLHLYDKAPENSDRREKLKIPIWAVASALNIVFAYRVATIMNVAMKCIVWGMAAFSTVSGFYFFFIFPKNSNNFYGACKPCIRWVERYFNDCLCNLSDEISFGFGLISLLCWAVAEIPQIITNFHSKSSNGVSLAFLMTWVVGDIFNLVGCLLEPVTVS
ncbi:uncharacterized protein LOC131233389 isoform X2 [Magnolia sinica]|uniref:uncharacterized protein LOC131233389 isoform X2 n=1 Tax=Magnolia sinica TaxID=86752 RepID=UPI002659D949|nr:uncharacterized protein LOC131233389 isoform X2 [Magnolia sinica]